MKKQAKSMILENTYYTITARNGKVLEVANYNTENGAAIQLWDYAGAPWQQWSFVSSGPSTYRIKNRFTGKCIDLALRGRVSGTLLHQWAETTNASQSWMLQHTGAGTRIVSIHANKYLDLAEMSTANGARAQIWDYVGGGNQEWQIKRVTEREKPFAQVPLPAGTAKNGDAAKPHQKKRKDDLISKINDKQKKKR